MKRWIAEIKTEKGLEYGFQVDSINLFYATAIPVMEKGDRLEEVKFRRNPQYDPVQDNEEKSSYP